MLWWDQSICTSVSGGGDSFHDVIKESTNGIDYKKAIFLDTVEHLFCFDGAQPQNALAAAVNGAPTQNNLDAAVNDVPTPCLFSSVLHGAPIQNILDAAVDGVPNLSHFSSVHNGAPTKNF